MLIAGAGMAGLVAAARARELGAQPVVLEKGDRAGGSMVLSSGVIWRYRSMEEFRRQCPGGDEALQRVLVERLEDGLDWLESLGLGPTERETANPLTLGRRYDPRALTDTLARAAGDVRFGEPFAGARRPVVLATGGFGARLARERALPLRANPWSEGDGLDYARAAGAAATAAMGEFYGRAMPAPPARWSEREYVDHAQLYGRFARVVDESGAQIDHDPSDWSENGLVQEIAARGGTAWYEVPRAALDRLTPYGTVRQVIERARRAGAEIRDATEMVSVHVVAAVTHTIGGIRVDERARVLDESGQPLDGVYAAGVDGGGVATGGYASGLAQALVLGLIAAEETAK